MLRIGYLEVYFFILVKFVWDINGRKYVFFIYYDGNKRIFSRG